MMETAKHDEQGSAASADDARAPVPRAVAAPTARGWSRRVNGAEIMAAGGLLAAAFSTAAGLLSQPRLVGAAGATMLLANAAALVLERTRRP